ncbi:MAG: UDP-2,3-diacylglucosamine diphosphatase [Methylophilaceae bacterium]|jgi:UDP-2,3-diacylglucosamine hydrolase|nr:UDP-2,3-diacylglucosamine diphosphatase [Methyloradius sp.]
MNIIGDGADFSLFISDLHLCHTRPAITALFIEFLQSKATQAKSLYILGDLFEYWAGDDDIDDPHHRQVIDAIKVLSANTPVYFIHGNRDFLISNGFANASNITLLADPTLLQAYGKRILISHGDELCTDDLAYQTFRTQVRNPAWQQQFLAQPLSSRKSQIEALRIRSETEKSQKSEAIMDVNDDAVQALFKAYAYPDLLIHGHTHRPAKHLLEIDSHHCERWVLGDWYDQGSCLRLDESGCSNVILHLH